MNAPEADLRPGTLLGRYRILAKLGEGGMGVVYRAHDTTLGRDVALKLLPASATADERAREALLREARTASQLQHPNVCTIHEVGEDGGRLYVAMALAEGRPLRELVPPGGLPDETVARIGAALARALAHAHERGVIHRDVKTGNVVVGADGEPTLLDFGLSSRVLDEASPRDDALAAAGAVAGTPQYLAPEVLLGHRAGASADLWSLGVVLYEICAGHTPFAASASGSVVTAILHANPSPLPAHTGPGLRAIVQRCLAKDPAQRYRNAGEVAAALEAALPGSLAATTTVPRGGAEPGRMRTLAFAALGVLLALLAIFAWRALRAPAGAPESDTVLVLPLDVRGAMPDSGFAGRALAEALAIQLAQARRLRVMPVPEASARWSEGALGRARAAYLAGAGRLVTGALAREGDSVRVSLSLVDTRANRVLWGEAMAAREGDLALLAPELAAPLVARLGGETPARYEYFLYGSGPAAMSGSAEWTDAIGSVRRWELPRSLDATAALLARFPREPQAHVLRLAALSIGAAARGADAPARQAIESEAAALATLDPANPWCDAARARLLAPGPRSLALLGVLIDRTDLTPAARGALLAMRSDQRIALGDTAAAITDAVNAVQLDPASDLSLATLARALTRAGRHGEAASRVRQALALNPTVVNYWLQLGNCMLKQGQWQEYGADLERAAALSPESDAILSAQCDGLACVGRWREAAAAARRAVAMRPDRWPYRAQLALASMRLGDWSAAAADLDRVVREGGATYAAVRDAAHAVVRAGAGGPMASVPASKSEAYALACGALARGDREGALGLLERFPAQGWVEPALEHDSNLAPLAATPRFRRVAAWMAAQPVDRVFADWRRSP